MNGALNPLVIVNGAMIYAQIDCWKSKCKKSVDGDEKPVPV